MVEDMFFCLGSEKCWLFKLGVIHDVGLTAVRSSLIESLGAG